MTLPNFLIIGAAKSGTTALYLYLRQHPQIFMSACKEPHHFSYTEQTKQTNGIDDFVRNAVTDFTAYQHLFDDDKNACAIGEASPTYLYVPGTAERIHEAIPQVKMIAILRNPVARAYSAYMHLLRDGREPAENFQEALALEEERIAKNWGPLYHYTKMGMYAEQLERFYNVFPKEQVKIILYEDFTKEPQRVLEEVYGFLGVDSHFLADMSIRPNLSGRPKSRFWQRVMAKTFSRPNPVRALSRVIFPESVRMWVTTRLRKMNLQREKLDETTRHELQEIFRADVLKLQEMLDCDLSAWL